MDRLLREAKYRGLFAAAGERGFTDAARAMCLSDLYFLIGWVLGRKDIRRDWLYDRCREVQANPDGYIDLWAREHYKSTIITFGKTIQDILADPEITVGIFSHTRPIAKGFLIQIKRELESNVLLKQLFPDVLWDNPVKDAPKWSEDLGLIVKRKGNPKESTIEAWGLVDGQPTSKHFSLLVYDDIVTKESVSTPDMIAKVTESWSLSLNLGAAGGRRRHIGTRFHVADTYREIVKRGAAQARVYPATADGNMEGGPVLLSRETLDEKLRDMGPYVFGCQMLLDPTADKVQGFKEEWLLYWDPTKPGAWDKMNRYILVDPANEKKKTSDHTVMVVIGLAEDGNRYLIHGIRGRFNLTERTSRLIALHREYAPISGVGYESYGIQADIQHIQHVQNEQQYRFPITALGGQMPKNDRIRRLIPIFQQGRFYMPWRCLFVDHDGKTRDFTRELIDDEYLAFPVLPHDDMLDDIARILDADLGATFPMRLSEERRMNTMAKTEYDVFGLAAGG